MATIKQEELLRIYETEKNISQGNYVKMSFDDFINSI